MLQGGVGVLRAEQSEGAARGSYGGVYGWE